MEISSDKYESIKEMVESLAYIQRNKPFHKWPMVRDLANKFMITQDLILDMVDDSDHLDIVAGIRSGGGVYSLAKGEQRVEWIQD